MNDILLNEEGDLLVKQGDLWFGDATEQHIALLFASSPGEWKKHPEVGIAYNMSQNGAVDRFLERTIRVQLEADGFGISYLKLNEEGVQLDGNYQL